MRVLAQRLPARNEGKGLLSAGPYNFGIQGTNASKFSKSSFNSERCSAPSWYIER